MTHDPSQPHYTATTELRSDPLMHHHLVNTIANVVTAICAVLIAIEVL
jgi:hypothetical protein